MSASDPLPGGGDENPVNANASNEDNRPILMPVDVDDLNEDVGRDGSDTPRSTSHAESVEIRFEEPEVIAGDTGANRAEDIPLDVGGSFG